MTTYRKKMIEVALPLEAINVASAREKSIRHGHPSTLHLWWARRPLAACRAVLFASLVDDPDSDPAYAHYGVETREHMAGEKRQQLFDLITELVQWENSNNELVINAARAEIARCVASRKIETGELEKDHKLPGGETVHDLVVKGHGDLPRLRAGTARLPNTESVNTFLAEHAPPVLDPFAGGGSIPLEAQRLGLRAYASDLNPVPVLINKALIEIPPKFANMPPVNPKSRGEAGPAGKHGKGRGKSVTGQSEWRGAQGLADDVRYYGKWMRDEAERRIDHLYPKAQVKAEIAKDRPDLQSLVGAELTTIAWLWARTVASPNPVAQGARVPLISSFMLSTKTGKKSWVEVRPDPSGEFGWRFEVRSGELSPEGEERAKSGTRAGKAKDFICTLTGSSITRSYVQSEGKAGRLGVRLMAVVAEGSRGRIYLPPDERSESAAAAAELFPAVETSRQSFLSGTTPTRAMITGGVCSAYGLTTWGHLFTARQIVSLTTLSDLVGEVRERICQHASQAEWAAERPARSPEDCPAGIYGDAVATYLAFAVDRALDRTTTICTWDSSPKMEALRSTFARQALPMTWDFAEGNPFSESSGNWAKNLDWVATALASLPSANSGFASQTDATASIGAVKGVMVSTDPPYYDNISYAELSDFFYVWLRRSLVAVYPSLFATLLTPKKQELIASAYRHDGNGSAAKAFFEEGLERAFGRMREAQVSDCPLTVYYAFKQSETEEDSDDDNQPVVTASTGWETMLAGLMRAGFGVTGTWPLRTELANRMVGIGNNALASSIVLCCRPRPTDSPLATRREFLNALKRELLPTDWNPAADKKVRHWEVAQHLIRALETGGESAAAALLRKVGGLGEVARDLAYRLYILCERKKWASEALAYNGLVISWPEISKLAQAAARPVESQGEMFT